MVIAALLLLAYTGVCTLLYFQQRALVYFPQATRVAAQATDFSLVRNGVTLRGWRLNPGQGKALIYLGGNAESLQASRAEFAGLFPGRTVYLLAYRGYGASEGTPVEAELFGDALALYDQIKAQHPHTPVAVIGRSLGSGVASYLASKRPVERLVLVTPFDSLVEVAQSHYPLFPVRWLLRERYDSTQYLPHYRGPLLILRAGQDRVVPPANTDRLLASLANGPRVVDFPDAGHDDISDHPGYSAAMQDFLR